MRLQILSIIAAALTASCAAAPYNVTDILEIVNSLRAQIHTTDKLATQIVTPDGGDNKELIKDFEDLMTLAESLLSDVSEAPSPEFDERAQSYITSYFDTNIVEESDKLFEPSKIENIWYLFRGQDSRNKSDLVPQLSVAIFNILENFKGFIDRLFILLPDQTYYSNVFKEELNASISRAISIVTQTAT